MLEPRAGFEPATCRCLGCCLRGGCFPVPVELASARLSHRGFNITQTLQNLKYLLSVWLEQI
jgi:hypothetical protein